MAVDTPAKIAILGAGPIGLEAALYARFLGYDVSVYERGRVAENVRRWGHVRMFSPFRLNRSTLALAALAAQDPGWQAPADDALLTGAELAERFLLPLSKTDLLDSAIFDQTEVRAVTRRGLHKGDLVGDPQRAENPLQLLLRDRQGRESTVEADIVIDATGTYGNANHLGGDGNEASGEHEAADLIQYDLPDILGADRGRYAGRHALLVGGGHSAATSIVALATLAAEAMGIRVTWITRRGAESGTESGAAGPISSLIDDPLTERVRLAAEANRLAAGASSAIRHIGGVTINRIDRRPDGGLEVRLNGEQGDAVVCDCILAQVGYRPDHRISAELNVSGCEATGGPRRPAIAMSGQSGAEETDPISRGAASLMTSEPNFYVLGSKSYGRNSGFLISAGLAQIRDLFGLIGGRASLDLYQDLQNLI